MRLVSDWLSSRRYQLGYKHYINVTSASWHFKSLANWLLVQKLIQAKDKDNIKALHYWPGVKGISIWPVVSPDEWPVMQKVVPWHDITMKSYPGGEDIWALFNRNMPSYQHRNSHYKDKMVLWTSCLNNGNPYAQKYVFLPEASFGLRVLSLPASVRVGVNHRLVRTITCHSFKLESLNLN